MGKLALLKAYTIEIVQPALEVGFFQKRSNMDDAAMAGQPIDRSMVSLIRMTGRMAFTSRVSDSVRPYIINKYFNMLY